MEIAEIRQRLTLAELVRHYGLKADKQNRLRCPFHDDKTPSLQLYYKTQTAFCFSSNCKINGKAVDVIDFILYKEGFDKLSPKDAKHEAIQKAVEMLGILEHKKENKNSSEKIIGGAAPSLPERAGAEAVERAMFLERMFTYFKNAVHNSKPAQEYLEKRCIDFRNTDVGYNAGQFHHGTRKDEALIKECLEYGILLDLGMKARTGDVAYKPFGKWCIVFAMRNKTNEIVSLYFRSTLADKEQRHFYLRDRQGLYPNYPPANTRKLLLTESIIDCVTLLQQPEIASRYNLLALYGTNGLTDEHQKSIKALKELEEIIFFLNGDEPGQKAVAKYAPMLKAEYPNLKITSVAVPQNEDVNSLLQGHNREILTHLIDTRKECDFILSNEKSIEKEKTETLEMSIHTEQPTKERAEQQPTGLNTNNPYNLKYQGKEATYQIKGFRIEQLDSLKITLQIQVQ
ncbi:toprim domain-containing protein [Pedobacter sp. ISL-68]|uniref:toprim domain-containing protein n=1 Tax=unclassified Pedobacter TaxID=2628915 RepID=UPI001BE620CC|nr:MULTISPECIES: toprim domain-containing protein [unclassified Pedobacter]MBT2563798.1 toprim domain-containing protein [Pedobacter sp. ISL-64]MBT2592796.1 toprim domain-containing protein [Pedobacter sp. ISL-68]